VIEKEELQTLIPHRASMLLLSRVIEYDLAGTLRAEYDITGDCLFYDPALEGVPAWAGFELIAQAISSLSGIRDRARGRKSQFGFILSIPSMRIYTPVLRAGGTADIRITEIDCTGLVFTFAGELLYNGTKALEGKIMVMEVENEQEFISQFKEQHK
jgi:predicted hotdog family 3-hydroxylacyl-ACP dehydratase